MITPFTHEVIKIHMKMHDALPPELRELSCETGLTGDIYMLHKLGMSPEMIRATFTSSQPHH